MPYTLMKGWAWVLVGVLLGLLIGWLLRSIAAKRQINRARKLNVDAEEVVRLRGRVADLEQAKAERDLLKLELDNYRARGAPNITQLQGIASTPPTPRVSPPPEPDTRGSGLRVSSEEHHTESEKRHNHTESEEHHTESEEHHTESGKRHTESGKRHTESEEHHTESEEHHTESESAVVSRPVSPSAAAGGPTLPARPGAVPIFPGSPPPPPDVTRAREVLGTAIQLDDLKAVEGIGPKIEGLCQGIGIHTWFDLSMTEVSLLRTMLTDAGPRFRTHDPGTWPDQAALLAAGRWEDFKALTDGLRGGRAVD